MDTQEEVLKKLMANSLKTLATLDVMLEVFAQLYAKVDKDAIEYETVLVNLRNEIKLRLEKSEK